MRVLPGRPCHDAPSRLGEQTVNVHRSRAHLYVTVFPSPLVARAIPIYLDPVLVGIGKVPCFAYEVIPLPQWQAEREPVAHPSTEISACREKDGEVV